jgi:hypothetical protein
MRSSTRILDVGREKHIMARPAQPRSVASQAGSDPIGVRNVGPAEAKSVRCAGLSLLVRPLSDRRRFTVEHEPKRCDPAGYSMLWQHTGFPRRKSFPSTVEILLTGEDVEFQAALPPCAREIRRAFILYGLFFSCCLLPAGMNCPVAIRSCPGM